MFVRLRFVTSSPQGPNCKFQIFPPSLSAAPVHVFVHQAFVVKMAVTDLLRVCKYDIMLQRGRTVAKQQER